MALYLSLRLAAQRLIQKNGRSVTYRQPSTTLVDAVNPQLGTTGVTDTSVRAAFIIDTTTRRTREIVQTGDRVCLVAADDLPSIVPRVNDLVIDAGVQWTIKDVVSIDPSDAPVVYQFILRT